MVIPDTQPYAGFWRRVLATLIDGLFIMFAIGIAWFSQLIVQVLTVAVEGGEAWRESLQMMELLSYLLTFDVRIESLMDLQLTLTTWTIWMLYTAAFESSSWQATPGKRMIGVKVTDYDGNRLEFPQALLRNFGKVFSDITLCIGYIFVGITRHKQALHDMLAEALVVKG